VSCSWGLAPCAVYRLAGGVDRRTESQVDIRPQTQIQEAQELATGEGYRVVPEHIIGCDWYSLSVWDSPAMEGLKDLGVVPQAFFDTAALKRNLCGVLVR